ncbi:hypothetical protein BBBOND_0102980 [Babesia bigemina]|uniref:Uncharacterized protein n=1 Tax=Babesia bigemina TaxID=5866 RepID=A0A061CZC5_BABBI|nr:hypothetical protein BBBOND_0102980 [Babesia bigemina]CDR93976.1 hypothetical protein BBBOND_0102980 [Babesia bigemina]|eukprot:XP_012766162.1 hypothetical protein BBBOND_0102980 [Babesia bigemina]
MLSHDVRSITTHRNLDKTTELRESQFVLPVDPKHRSTSLWLHGVIMLLTGMSLIVYPMSYAATLVSPCQNQQLNKLLSHSQPTFKFKNLEG